MKPGRSCQIRLRTGEWKAESLQFEIFQEAVPITVRGAHDAGCLIPDLASEGASVEEVV
jgi:hypothetical protein